MGCSVVVTVRNDEDGVHQLVSSLKIQTVKPDQIIIVDGGSKLEIVDRLTSLFNDSKWIKFIKAGNVNISQGRNIGIQAASNEIIAVTDCGCIQHPKWLENITRPFLDKDVSVVSGWYLPDSHNEFEELLSSITLLTLRSVEDKDFIPSSRSLAFKKDAWEKVGGYPEDLYTAEDTVFFLNMKKLGENITVARDAVVYWRPRTNLREVHKQYFLYSRGDGNAVAFLPRYIARLLVYLGVIVSIILKPLIIQLILSIIFIIYIFRYIKRTKDVRARFIKKIITSVLIIIVMDTGTIAGYIVGIWDRLTGRVLIGRVF